MTEEPNATGVGKGLVVLGVLWWSWVGYSWLTSVVNPEEGSVRLAIFAAMAAFLVASLAVPRAFGDSALIFAVAYGIVRVGQVALFTIASRDDPQLRRSVQGLAVSTAIGVTLLTVASATDGPLQGGLWVLALVLDVAGPLFFGAEGWRLAPEHFAERHGLVILIALGESIVALGVGAEAGLDAGIVVAAVLGVAVAAAFWWLYFDVVALVAGRRLASRTDRRERNEMARDSYSLIHFPMIAGITLTAFGLEETLAHTDEHLHLVPAAGLLGGAALYLLAHVGFRLRNIRTFNRHRTIAAVVLLALVPAATAVPALVVLGALAAGLSALIAFEALHFADARARVRSELAGAPGVE